MTKDATIYGMSLFNSPRSASEEIHSAIFEGLNKGFLKPVVRDCNSAGRGSSGAPRSDRIKGLWQDRPSPMT